MKQLSSHQTHSFKGMAEVSGDKSISHRAIMIASIAVGKTNITGLLEGEDVLATVDAFKEMGAIITKNKDKSWEVTGVGLGGLKQPTKNLDMGNSGTSTRLIMGIVAGENIRVTITGDKSLSARPMGRVIKPLSEMGISIIDNNGCLPLTINPTDEIMPIIYPLPVASAQVKSCVLFAGLSSRGNTTVIENEPTRNHTENMLRHFGCSVETTEKNGKTEITVFGGGILKAQNVIVPSDPSSASFVIAAACIVKGAEITVQNVCINPTRIGFFTTLLEMGADITYQNKRTQAGEPVADINVKYAKLKGISVPAERAPSMIDEYPILSIVASFAQGITIMNGIEELRFKESDRLKACCDGLTMCGVKNESGKDWLRIQGDEFVKGGGVIKTLLDHRLAMSFLVMGMASQNPTTIDDCSPINTSFPTFINLMSKLGANFSE